LKDFQIIYVDGVFVIEINLIRSTLNEAIAFRKILEKEINSGHTKLVIDLSKCDYMDSSFFGAIVLASKMLNQIGYKLKVVKPAIAEEDIFTHINTSSLFDKYKTREEAIKSFEEDIQPES